MISPPGLKLSLDLELGAVSFGAPIRLDGIAVTSRAVWSDGGVGVQPITLIYADTDAQVVAIRGRSLKWTLVPYGNVTAMEVRGDARPLPEDRARAEKAQAVAPPPEVIEEMEAEKPKRSFRGKGK